MTTFQTGHDDAGPTAARPLAAQPADAGQPAVATSPGAPAPAPATAPWASITACPDGPLLVRGDVEILGPDGTPVPRRRPTVALCRCGASGIKPFCDGSHKVVGFRTDDEDL
ncbi:CDGSH iron-sulfur domain-containing protein [Actinotalea soli]|uniref:CDGSH iron-sulfur domain-containing protein n=1 Tax=Actinotalea soli TaxID=2819234 RepID=UPI0027DE7B35|nr:CDGSH iron-sulfur domain-containing protein [Actinotalea soli]